MFNFQLIQRLITVDPSRGRGSFHFLPIGVFSIFLPPSLSLSLSLSLVRALSPLSHAPFFYGFLGWVLRTGEPAVFGEAELLDLVCRMFRVRDV